MNGKIAVTSKSVARSILCAAIALSDGIAAFAASGPVQNSGFVILDTTPSTHAGNIAKPDGELPRIVGPVTPATTRINAALARANARWLLFAKDCIGHAKDAEATRTAEVTMRGPRFLSIVTRDEIACAEAAHPDNDALALVFDLASGLPVNWLHLLPRGLAAGQTDSIDDGSAIGLLASPDLDALYLAMLKRNPLAAREKTWWSECGDVLDDTSLGFVAWPDPTQGGVALEPVLPHVVAACGEVAVIPIAWLRAHNADRDFVQALGAAAAAPK